MVLFNLLPKEEKFFTHLTTMAEHANTCAHLLKDYVSANDSAARTRKSAEVSACKAQSKKIIGQLTEDLCRSFITPFDREDIQAFAQQLYRITKIIEKVIHRMELHDLIKDRSDFVRQTDLIVSEAEVMIDMVSDLIAKKNSREVTKKVGLLHDLEQRGDDVLQDLTRELFSQNREARELILRKDIYDMLEKAVDGYRNVAAVTLQIVLKYS